MTSRWIEEVARLREGVTVQWHVLSLRILNRDNTDEGYLKGHAVSHAGGHEAGRVAAGAMSELDNARVKAFYDAVGQRVHPGGRSDWSAVIDEAAAEAGIPAELVARAREGAFDAELQASHDDGISRVGQDVGTPIISVNGVAVFGPVISPAPKGEEALRLFDGIVAAAAYDGFFELKRSRTRRPEFN